MIFEHKNYFIYGDARVGSTYLRSVLRNRGYNIQFTELHPTNLDFYCHAPKELLLTELQKKQPFAIKIRSNTYDKLYELVEEFDHHKVFLYRNSISKQLKSLIVATITDKWVWLPDEDASEVDVRKFDSMVEIMKENMYQSILKLLTHYQLHHKKNNNIVIAMEDVVSISGGNIIPTPNKIYDGKDIDLSNDNRALKIIEIANNLGFKMGI